MKAPTNPSVPDVANCDRLRKLALPKCHLVEAVLKEHYNVFNDDCRDRLRKLLELILTVNQSGKGKIMNDRIRMKCINRIKKQIKSIEDAQKKEEISRNLNPAGDHDLSSKDLRVLFQKVQRCAREEAACGDHKPPDALPSERSTDLIKSNDLMPFNEQSTSKELMRFKEGSRSKELIRFKDEQQMSCNEVFRAKELLGSDDLLKAKDLLGSSDLFTSRDLFTSEDLLRSKELFRSDELLRAQSYLQRSSSSKVAVFEPELEYRRNNLKGFADSDRSVCKARDDEVRFYECKSIDCWAKRNRSDSKRHGARKSKDFKEEKSKDHRDVRSRDYKEGKSRDCRERRSRDYWDIKDYKEDTSKDFRFADKSQDFKEEKSKDRRDANDYKEGKSKDYRELRDYKEGKSKDYRDVVDYKEGKSKDHRDVGDYKEGKSKDYRDIGDYKEGKSKDYRDLRDYREGKSKDYRFADKAKDFKQDKSTDCRELGDYKEEKSKGYRHARDYKEDKSKDYRLVDKAKDFKEEKSKDYREVWDYKEGRFRDFRSKEDRTLVEDRVCRKGDRSRNDHLSMIRFGDQILDYEISDQAKACGSEEQTLDYNFLEKSVVEARKGFDYEVECRKILEVCVDEILATKSKLKTDCIARFIKERQSRRWDIPALAVKYYVILLNDIQQNCRNYDNFTKELIKPTENYVQPYLEAAYECWAEYMSYVQHTLEYLQPYIADLVKKCHLYNPGHPALKEYETKIPKVLINSLKNIKPWRRALMETVECCRELVDDTGPRRRSVAVNVHHLYVRYHRKIRSLVKDAK